MSRITSPCHEGEPCVFYGTRDPCVYASAAPRPHRPTCAARSCSVCLAESGSSELRAVRDMLPLAYCIGGAGRQGGRRGRQGGQRGKQVHREVWKLPIVDANTTRPAYKHGQGIKYPCQAGQGKWGISQASPLRMLYILHTQLPYRSKKAGGVARRGGASGGADADATE